MTQRSSTMFALLLLLCGTLAQARADLHAYLARPEPAYKWEKLSEKKVDGVTIYSLHLVSQVWQGHTWEHDLQLFRPDTPEYPGFCGIYNTGGGAGRENEAFGVRQAKTSGASFAIVYGNPKQPLYGGLTEDALIVYTWKKYIETGDDSWPLHFPMAKAVLKAMDAVQELAKSEKLPEIKEFMVCGASKRGWTTWLVGASRDPRVKAIAPMVIDVLNVTAQMKHMLEAYQGKPSEQIEDYTSAGVAQLLQTEAGQRLMKLEDPYSYRDIITMPKLLILGTNDRYWTQDALNIYWDELKGPKWVIYIPNSGHGLEDRARVMNTLSAFIRAQASRKPFPKTQWEYQTKEGGAQLTLRSSIPAKEARLFHNSAPTQDFRDAKWTFDPMEKTNSGFTGFLKAPEQGYAAMYGEFVYEIDGRPFTLTSQIRILGGK